jgi:ornithine carbamoyltransferase
MEMKNLISLAEVPPSAIDEILSLAARLKKKNLPDLLKGKALGLVFKKSSTRTRVSFEVAIHQLGGYAIFLRTEDVQIGRGETVSDTAKVLSRYLDGMVIRTFDHNEIIEYAKNATIPVINGLTDLSHPCQVLCDLFTIKEKKKKLAGLKVAYIGDGSNNMAHSWIFAAIKTGIDLSIATPGKYPPAEIIRKIARGFGCQKGSYVVTDDPDAAARGADVIYTDVWVSMGQEKERQKKLRDLKKYQVNGRLLALAKKDCMVMHCLPAHRGEEITADVIDGKNSVIFDQAENRLHVQKAILALLMK